MKKLLTITAALLALSSVNAIASDYEKTQKNTETTVGEKIDDAKIVTLVNAELVKDKDLSAIQINVDSNKGNVILRGIAPNVASKLRAETIAKSVTGVVMVDNRLEVTNTNTSINSGKDVTSNTHNTVDKAGNTLGAKIDDAGINVAVNSKLASDDELSATKINVDVKNGKVLLKGTAPNLVAKNRASKLAKEVEGVTSVNNKLTIKK